MAGLGAEDSGEASALGTLTGDPPEDTGETMAGRKLDDIDRALIAQLGANARLPTAALARRVGLSRSAVQERLRRLECDGVILGYTTVLAAAAGKPTVRAQVLLALDPKLQNRAIEALRGLPGVMSATTLSGAYDLVAEVAAADGEALDELLTRIGTLPGVVRTTSSILLSVKFDRR